MEVTTLENTKRKLKSLLAELDNTTRKIINLRNQQVLLKKKILQKQKFLLNVSKKKPLKESFEIQSDLLIEEFRLDEELDDFIEELENEFPM